VKLEDRRDKMMTFEHQISGHSNTISISNSNSSSIIKLTNLIELNFYSITSKLLTNQPFIGTWIPTFWGTLSHQHDDDKKKIMLVLENLTFPFLKPNILDVKLGNELFDVNASLQKQMKLTNLSKETTSSSNSLRISAFKVILSFIPFPFLFY
jgi:1D-myo-inositol-tetrakisphosphate 5-kinase/inositol-polyphosphate multikinase